MVFSNNLLISIVANFLNSNGDKQHLTPVMEALEYASVKTNEVMTHHQIVASDSNLRMLDAVRNINLTMSQNGNDGGVSCAPAPAATCLPITVVANDLALSLQSSSTEGALTIDLEARSPSFLMPPGSAPTPMSVTSSTAPPMLYTCQSGGMGAMPQMQYCAQAPMSQTWSSVPMNIPTTTQSYPQQVTYPFQPPCNQYTVYPMQPVMQMPQMAPEPIKKS